MSEEPIKELVKEPFDDLTAQEVIDFLADKGAKGECSVCNVNQWTMGERVNECGPVILTVTKTYGILGTPLLATVLMVCNNCGYIRTHLRQPILDWVEIKKKEV